MDIGQLVLDRLVTTDRAAELSALFGVRDRHIQHRLAGADQLRGGGQCAELECPCNICRVGLPGPGQVEQPAARVDGTVPFDGDRIADLSIDGQQSQTREVGVDRPGYCGR